MARAGLFDILLGFDSAASAAELLDVDGPLRADDGSKIQLLTQHYYRGDGSLSTSTVAKLLTVDTGSAELDNLAKAAQTANISGAIASPSATRTTTAARRT